MTGFTIAVERPQDVAAREVLLDDVMGEIRFRRSSERIREGRLPAENLALVAHDDQGNLCGTVRLWDAKACGLTKAVMLGPLAVSRHMGGAGIGSALMRTAIEGARAAGYDAIVLVGDPDYYARFGFSARVARRLAMPGPFERHRMLGLELTNDALAHAHGTLKAAGRTIEPVEEIAIPALKAANAA